MNKIYAFIASLITGLTLIAAAPTATAAPSSSLEDRLTICRTDEGDALAPDRPCVWLASFQGNGQGHSLIARRGGRVEWIGHGRATRLFLAALYRNEVLGSRGGDLEARVNICWDPVGGSGSGLPCVYPAALHDEPGQSVLVRRSGRIQPVDDQRARDLTLTVAYR